MKSKKYKFTFLKKLKNTILIILTLLYNLLTLQINKILNLNKKN